MREIEIKAHARDIDSVLGALRSELGEGKGVHKHDRYFRRPGEAVQSMRIRRFPDRLEFTTKVNSREDGAEDNREYEFTAPLEELEGAVAFFHALGHEDFFIKEKDGYEWQRGDAHIELLSVNDLGWFLEIEVLLPFDSTASEAEAAREEIKALLKLYGVSEDDIETRAYRDMILGAQ